MLEVMFFAMGALTGGLFAWLCNLRGLYRSEQRADERARLTEIHIQGLHNAVRQLIAEDEAQTISPAEKALLREYRVKYAANQGDAKK